MLKSYPWTLLTFISGSQGRTVRASLAALFYRQYTKSDLSKIRNTCNRHCILEAAKQLMTSQHDTRCYFNVRSKANMSQLNLPRNRQLKSVKKQKKTKSRKQTCPEITVNSPENPCSKYLSRKKDVQVN